MNLDFILFKLFLILNIDNVVYANKHRNNKFQIGRQFQIPINYFPQIISNQHNSPLKVVNVEHNIVYDDYSGPYMGSQLWKIHTIDLNGPIMKKLKNLKGAEIWDMNQDGIDIFYNNKNSSIEGKKIIDGTDLTYNVMIDNVQSEVFESKTIVNITKRNVPWSDDLEIPMTWDRYNELHVFDDFFHYVLSTYPKAAEIITIGRSLQKRDFKVLKISNGNQNNRAIFIDSGMQAREWIGPAATTFAIMKLIFKWNERSDFLKDFDWYFLPVVNPDGYEHSWTVDRLWSKNRNPSNENCFGVNIDRNFSYKWGKRGSSADPCSRYYRGSQAFSEPESKALKNFLEKIGPKLGAYISIGSYNQQIIYPWGDNNFVPENEKLLHTLGKIISQGIRKSTRTEFKTGSSYSLKFARAGNSADWVMDEIHPEYVYNLYLRDQGRYGYLLPPEFIVQSGYEVFEVMKTIASALNLPEQSTEEEEEVQPHDDDSDNENLEDI